MGRMYNSMKLLRSEDDGTKRFLLGLQYLDQQANARKITLNSVTGEITFDL